MPPNPTLEKIRKSQILDASLRIMSEQGSNSVTLEHVAKASGLSKGGLVHYFPSKEVLFRESFREFFNRIFTRGRETMDQHADAMDKLLSFIWIFDRDDPEVQVAYPLLFDGMALAAHDPEYGSLFRDWFESWVVMLKVALKQGNDAGRFSVADTDGTARAISAIYQGIATRWFLDPETHSTDWAESFLRLAITGLVGLKET
ncbi:MAG: TetR/AcrR family transcriptional regulator [Desulfomonile tiedjei]|nr:TetR/AcrR family transcriptional regulator [Desulfomonile tiedjei]